MRPKAVAFVGPEDTLGRGQVVFQPLLPPVIPDPAQLGLHLDHVQPVLILREVAMHKVRHVLHAALHGGHVPWQYPTQFLCHE